MKQTPCDLRTDEWKRYDGFIFIWHYDYANDYNYYFLFIL